MYKKNRAYITNTNDYIFVKKYVLFAFQEAFFLTVVAGIK